jgi:superfamily II DNA or RNA helicase
MAQHWDDLLQPTSILDPIDQGFLCKFVVFAPKTPDLRRVHTLAGDYREDELAYACDTDELVGNIVDTWFLRAAGLPTICYGVNQAHAKHIMCRFIAAGVAAEYIDCFTPLNERDKVFDRLSSQRLGRSSRTMRLWKS